MSVDIERVMQKIAFIREQLMDIEALTSVKKREEILSDKLLVKGLKYSLQTAIESMIDIAFHLAAKKYNCAPEEARSALQILVKKNVISDEEYKTFSRMIGFRNRMVHLYQNVSDERVYEFSTSELNDFEVFINRILEVLHKS